MLKSIEGKKVAVVGLARSGIGATNLLAHLGAIVTVIDKKEYWQLNKYLNMLNQPVELKLGKNSNGSMDKFDLIVISPGVPLSLPMIKSSSEKGITIIGELELGYQILNELCGELTFPSFLSITGTNGKSTTCTLLYEIVKNNGFKVVLAGNIGNALTGFINKSSLSNNCESSILNNKYIVTEVSSFQLETIEKFRPKCAAILNITPDHLDRYSSIREYIEAKCRIFINQGKTDFLILNADDPMTTEIEKRLDDNGPKVFYFSIKQKVSGIYCEYEIRTDSYIFKFNLPDFNYSIQESLKIKGLHNVENVLAASLMAKLSGCSIDSILSTLKNFKGLEHRLEFVNEIDGVKFFNDSKGTNVWAVIKSLESFQEPIVLIAGGRDKDSDFSVLEKLIKDNVKAAILIGEAREKIKKTIEKDTNVYLEDNLEKAVWRSKDIAAEGDVVLLSPACASFDMFKDYEDRGRKFKSAVSQLSENKGAVLQFE